MRFNLGGLWSQLHCLLWTLPLVSWFHLLCIYAIAGWWFAIYRSPVAEGKKTFIRQPRQFLNFTQPTWLLPHINTAPYKWQPVELSSEQPVALHMELYLALALATTVFALNEKGPPILPILPVDIDHGYVRRAANVDVPLVVPSLQKSNNPEPLADLNEINHGGVVYTDTVDDGYDYSNNYYAKRAAYEDTPWS